ncbi:MAG TPA: MCE family protein [Marmoricola sp.]|nr:MCE family protein [Marmoricola sp.]
MRTALRHRLLGIVFIGLMILGVWLVNAVFTQQFVSFDKVSLHTDSVGLQLPARADVKVRGVLVGEVLDMVPNGPGKGATLELGIHPDKISQIPADVTASIVPKTLFGEKYVALDIPHHPTATPLQAGDHISQTKLPVEVEKVLSDLYPLLRTVQPAELNYTLNAIADALEGRGKQIGENITTLDHYLTRLNPQLPALLQDIRLLSRVSGNYADVAPQIVATLRNTTKTGNTLVSEQQKLHQFLRDATAFSDTTRGFLDTNGDNIIRLGQVSRPVLALLARYSPEYPCLLRGLVRQIPRLASTFRGFVFHIQLITLPKQPRGYTPRDLPVYGDDRGPSCGGLPYPYGSPSHPYQSPNFDDGVNDATLGKRTAPGFARRDTGLTAGVSGTASQKALLRALAAPVLGVPADKVSDMTTLLFAPLVAGTEVSVR